MQNHSYQPLFFHLWCYE